MRIRLGFFPKAAKDKAPILTLPQAVYDAIESVSIVSRGCDEEGIIDRVIVQFHGWNGWLYSDEGAAKAFARMFPDLDERQVTLAVARLSTRIKAHLKRLDQVMEPARRPWKDRY